MAILQLPSAQAWQYTNITTNTTTLIKSGIGMLHNIIINAAPTVAAETLTVFDNTTNSGAIICTFTVPTTFIAPQSFNFDCNFALGLTIVTATGTGPNFTIIWA